MALSVSNRCLFLRSLPRWVRNTSIDRAAAVVSLVAQMCNARGWFEYIESKSNWSDGLSRLLVEDPWVASRGFTLRQMEVPVKPWIVPIQELLPLLESEIGAALELF